MTEQNIHTPGLKPNRDYGTGIFRRRILIKTGVNKTETVAELEDCVHGFRLVVNHENNIITDVQAEALRIPLTSAYP